MTMVRSRPWHYSKRSKGQASTVPGREVEGRGEPTPFVMFFASCGPGGGGFRWRQGARPVVLPGAGAAGREGRGQQPQPGGGRGRAGGGRDRSGGRRGRGRLR